MTRSEYIEQLKQKLSGLSEEETIDALSYCNEYFDEAGTENEEQAIHDLGSPTKFAAQLQADAIAKSASTNRVYNEKRSQKRPLKNIWIMIIGICALPIALPLGFALVAVVFSLLLALACVAFALVLVLVALIIAGGLSFAYGIYHFSTDVGTSFIALGMGLTSIGLAVLALMLIMALIRKGIPSLTDMVARVYQRYRGKEMNV